MKKLLFILFIFGIGAGIFSACEKDDICPPETLTTPYLKVGFFNFNNQEREKAVPKLRVLGVNVAEDGTYTIVDTLNTFPDRSNRVAVDLPLKTSENTSTFLLINNSRDNEDGEEIGNIDTLQFNYTRQERFISRGCGYGVNFTDLVTILNPDYNDTVQNPNEWVTAIFDQETNLENQDTIHVKIFH
ncbi:hypothetical protein HX109_08380 [Galbibacter sp. BG1]|uniref:DUF6452 family protein n=1 Tax=Galbibacter sp. BG1 TaxID=1170699 RepID=UPI0015BBE3EA|nr:DUF6452 family protein [Galbibacter sp. BG1]QLE01579.1 hypothetical protein HX109_08380 [Galbibacter sp. BG1]